MIITQKEFLKKPKKYIRLSKTEDIDITKNGRIISQLTNPKKDFDKEFDELFGSITEDLDYDQIRYEALTKV